MLWRHYSRGGRAGIGNQIGHCGGAGKLRQTEIEIHWRSDQRRRRANANTIGGVTIRIQTLQQARNIQHHWRAGVEALRHIQRSHYAIGRYRRKFQRADKERHRLTRQIIEFTLGIGDAGLGFRAIANARHKSIYQHTDFRRRIRCSGLAAGRLDGAGLHQHTRFLGAYRR